MATTGSDEEFDVNNIRAALQQVVDKSDGSATLELRAVDEGEEEATIGPTRSEGVSVTFSYGTDPGEPGEVTAEMLNNFTPLMELQDVIEVAEAAVNGRVVSLEDAWGRREVQVTNADGITSEWSSSGLLGLIFRNRYWRRRAQRATYEPYS